MHRLSRAQRAALILCLFLLAMLLLACGGGQTVTSDPPAYCSMDPKPLICP